MYIPMVAALLFVVPMIFASGQLLLNPHSIHGAVAIIPIIAKWYVFWAVGVRLGVGELGFANMAIGGVGIATLFAPSRLIAALAEPWCPICSRAWSWRSAA